MFHRKLAAAAAFLFASSLVFAQTFRGGISGAVTDQSGAAVAGATVKLTGTDTGLSRDDQTGAAGDFTFQDLPLGKYSLNVTSAGFQSVDVRDINVEAGKIYDLPVHLNVATQATTVEVAASAIQVETSSTALTSVIPTKAILDIPLNGRDFTQLLKLNPGVNAAGSVNGTRLNAINWQIDGADNNDLWHNSAAVNQGGVSGIAGTVLPIDAIDEFSMQTNSSAEQGRNQGGVLNLVIKSGTNDFHGSLYYFNRNEFFAARDWFTPPGTPTAELRNNQEGGSLGGPIWKNHTFFFVTYEQQNFVAGNTAVGTTPSAAWVSEGEGVLARYGIPVSPVALNLINTLWPASSLTGPATQDNYFSSANAVYNSYNGIIKLDHIFNETNNIALRYFGGTGQQTAYDGSVVPYYYQVAPSRMHNFSLVYNHVFSPAFVSQTLLGVNYFKQVFGDANAGFNIPSLGLNTGVTNPSLAGSPDITINGFDEIGLTPPLGRIDTTGHIDETLTYTTGTHQFRFGGEYRRAQLDVFYETNSRGVFTFDGTQGPLAATDPTDTWGTGNPSLNSLADFLAGYVATNHAHITSGDLQRLYQLNGSSLFFQDSWKAKPNLTINYGLNWTFQSPIHTPTDNISTFLPDSGISYLGSYGLTTLWPRDFHDFGPRFGFAWQPKTDSKLVIRGGYGIFYQPPNVNYIGDNNTPNGAATGINDNPPVYTLSNQAPLQIQYGVPVFGNLGAPPPPYGALSVSQQFVDAYSQNTNLNAQYQLNSSTVVEVGYTGSLSRHLPVTLDINQIPIGAPEVNSSRPYSAAFPYLGPINQIESVANGYYNGAIASVRTSNWHRFNLKLSYTYGHSFDDASSTRNVIPQNSYCLRCDYGNSDYDVRQSFVTFVSYALPDPTHWKALLGGWQLNSLLTFYTGQPFTVLSGQDTSGTGENNDRAEVVGNPFSGVPASIPGAYAYWFNPNAFSLPAQGTYSNQSRNEFYGPGTKQIDFSVFKNFSFTERVRLQFRAEIFNIANFRDLAPPITNFSSSGLGQVTSTLDVWNGAPGIGTGAPRNIQFALKLLF